jgi:hypothetical protein
MCPKTYQHGMFLSSGMPKTSASAKLMLALETTQLKLDQTSDHAEVRTHSWHGTAL